MSKISWLVLVVLLLFAGNDLRAAQGEQDSTKKETSRSEAPTAVELGKLTVGLPYNIPREAREAKNFVESLKTELETQWRNGPHKDQFKGLTGVAVIMSLNADGTLLKIDVLTLTFQEDDPMKRLATRQIRLSEGAAIPIRRLLDEVAKALAPPVVASPVR